MEEITLRSEYSIADYRYRNMYNFLNVFCHDRQNDFLIFNQKSISLLKKKLFW